MDLVYHLLLTHARHIQFLVREGFQLKVSTANAMQGEHKGKEIEMTDKRSNRAQPNRHAATTNKGAVLVLVKVTDTRKVDVLDITRAYDVVAEACSKPRNRAMKMISDISIDTTGSGF